MASTLMDLTYTAQENFLGAMETSKSYTLESMKAFTETTKRMMPEMPEVPGMAGMNDMFDPAGAVAMTYDFAEKVLASQRDFVESMIATLAPKPA